MCRRPGYVSSLRNITQHLADPQREPAPVVVLLPVGDHDAGLGQAPEDVDVQALVADGGWPPTSTGRTR